LQVPPDVFLQAVAVVEPIAIKIRVEMAEQVAVVRVLPVQQLQTMEVQTLVEVVVAQVSAALVMVHSKAAMVDQVL